MGKKGGRSKGAKGNNKAAKGKKKTGARAKSSSSGAAGSLRAEVFALGGDEEDLRIIGEDEEGEEGQGDRGGQGQDLGQFSAQARKELEDLVKSLGLDKKFREGMPDIKKEQQDEAEEEEAEVVEEEDSSSEEEEEAQEDEATSDEEEEEAVQVEEMSSSTTSTSKDKKIKIKTEVKSEPAQESSSSSSANPQFHFLKEKPERSHCLVKAGGGKWTELIPSGCHEGDFEPTSAYWITKLEKHAAAALELECLNHAAKKKKGDKSSSSSSSEMAYIDTVLKSGALGDKISAYTVLLQEDPVHNLKALDSLVGMISLKSRRPCLMAMEALRELFCRGGLLAEDRKLRRFRENPFCRLANLSSGNKDTRDRYLILWLFEHKLKEAYGRFLSAMDEVAKDTIENTKTKAMQVFLDLLSSNPECEGELLERLVNKLGDPSRAVAAKAMYQLGVLLSNHPAMKEVVLKEVERILYRVNVGKKAQYYGVCFLSQVLLDPDESDLANRLIEIYFGFFKANVKKGEIDSKLMSALLTGVNRAYPFATVARDKLEDQVQVMFKLVHMLGNFNSSVQCLTLLYQIMDCGETATDRFYAALYRKLLDPGLGSTSCKLTVLLNLLFKSMRRDQNRGRVVAFVKRLLQVAAGLSSEVTCGILFLVSEVIRSRKDLSSASLTESAVGSGPGADMSKFDDDEEEHYEDVKEEEEGTSDSASLKEEEENKVQPTKNKTGSWVHKRNIKSGSSHRRTAGYDPHHRNPAFCGAEHSVLWELNTLSSHVHPTVSLFARNILDGTPIVYQGDPLQDFTLIRFLDRFVFRNPKKDPLKGRPSTVLSRKGRYVAKGVKGSVAPDSKEYANLDEAAVPLDERFIHRYFTEKRARKAAVEGSDEEDDADSVASEDFDAFMDGYFKKKGKGEEGVDEELDFAANVGELSSGDKDEESEEDDSEEEGSSGEEEEPELSGESGGSDLDLEDIEDVKDDDDGEDEFDEEGFAISDNDEEEEEVMPVKGKSVSLKRKSKESGGALAKKKLKKAGGGGDLQSLLASAEEFADLVEEAAADDIDLGGSGAMSNVKDKAGKKQLLWERDRDHGGKGKGKSIGGKNKWQKKGGGGGNKRQFGGKRKR